MTNKNGKTVDQKMRAMRVMFSRKVSDDKMPKESRDSMTSSVKTTLIDATNVPCSKRKTLADSMFPPKNRAAFPVRNPRKNS